MLRAQIPGANGKPVWIDARRTREENKRARTIHKTMEGLADLSATIQQAGEIPPFQVADLTKNMRRYTIEAQNGETIGWYNVHTTSIQWTRPTKEAFAKIGRDEDLEQIAAWASIG